MNHSLSRASLPDWLMFPVANNSCQSKPYSIVSLDSNASTNDDNSSDEMSVQSYTHFNDARWTPGQSPILSPVKGEVQQEKLKVKTEVNND